jgi:hypothetical protein
MAKRRQTFERAARKRKAEQHARAIVKADKKKAKQATEAKQAETASETTETE